jgi:hypothetical protein
MRKQTSLLLTIFASMALASACTNLDSNTELVPEGPPKILQVIMDENIVIDLGGSSVVREKKQLAFGYHPDIEDEDETAGVNAAVARGDQKIRVVVDELLIGNFLEEIACANGTFSTIPLDATPDDIAACANLESGRCQGDNAVCAGEAGGILDENEDGAADEFRMIRYGDGNLAARLECDNVNIPLDQERSFWSPSGNQLIPAGPIGEDGLGPALILVPENGMRTSSSCRIFFNEFVLDREGERVCAPQFFEEPAGSGNFVPGDCADGDTSLVSWTVEPLRIVTQTPRDGQQNVSVNATILFGWNAAIDPLSLNAITLSEVGGGTVNINPMTQADDPTVVTVEVVGGLQTDTDYTITIADTLADAFGGTLPAPITVNFSTGGGVTPPMDAGLL